MWQISSQMNSARFILVVMWHFYTQILEGLSFRKGEFVDHLNISIKFSPFLIGEAISFSKNFFAPSPTEGCQFKIEIFDNFEKF